MKCLKCPTETGADWKTLCLFHYHNRSIEEIRADRQKKLDKKIQRLRGKAESLEKIADGKQAAFNFHRGDIAFLTQPASKSTSFGRQREKIYKRYDQGLQLFSEAQNLREKADWLERRGAAVKGDAAKRNQAKRELVDNLFSVGSTVFLPSYGEGVIVKIFKKSCRVQFKSGFTLRVDKIFICLPQE